MSLFEQIKTAQLEARKSRDAVATSLLTTLLGEVSKVPAAKKIGQGPDGKAIYEQVDFVVTDELVIRTIKAFTENAKATRAALEEQFVKGTGHSSNDMKTRLHDPATTPIFDTLVPKMRQTDREIQILSSYLPQQMTRDELQAAINLFKQGEPSANVGQIMGHLKAHYAGLYDGKLASELARG